MMKTRNFAKMFSHHRKEADEKPIFVWDGKMDHKITYLLECEDAVLIGITDTLPNGEVVKDVKGRTVKVEEGILVSDLFEERKEK
jgi:hypothetical protein